MRWDWSRFRQDGERGVLLFTATMTVVRNGRVQEVPFDMQTEALGLGDRRGATLPTVAAREAGGGPKVHNIDVVNEGGSKSGCFGSILFPKVGISLPCLVQQHEPESISGVWATRRRLSTRAVVRHKVALCAVKPALCAMLRSGYIQRTFR